VFAPSLLDHPVVVVAGESRLQQIRGFLKRPIALGHKPLGLLADRPVAGIVGRSFPFEFFDLQSE
jgi:hypothetical protein